MDSPCSSSRARTRGSFSKLRATAAVGALALLATGGALPAFSGLARRTGTQAASAAVPPATPSSEQPTAQDRAQLEAEAQRARERLGRVTQSLDALAAQERTVLGDLRRLELTRQREALTEQAARAGAAAARVALAETNARTAQLEAAMADRRPALRAKLRRLYMLGPLAMPALWGGGHSPLERARAWRLLAALAGLDARAFKEAASARARLEALGNQHRAKAAEADELTRAAAAARRAAGAAAAAQASLVARVAKERDLNTQLADELRQTEDRLNAMLGRPRGTPGAAVTNAPARALTAFKGVLDWPVAGRVTTRFGRSVQRFGTVVPRNGVEIAAPASTPVLAIHDGTVVFAGEFAGLGQLVVVEHGGGVFSMYGHLAQMDVGRGAAVRRGTPVGTVGRTPAGTEAVYLELRIDGRPVDPLEWLKPSMRSRP